MNSPVDFLVYPRGMRKSVPWKYERECDVAIMEDQSAPGQAPDQLEAAANALNRLSYDVFIRLKIPKSNGLSGPPVYPQHYRVFWSVIQQCLIERHLAVAVKRGAIQKDGRHCPFSITEVWLGSPEGLEDWTRYSDPVVGLSRD